MNAILVAGAALVGLPILLHLIMKQEPKRLSFPAFRFLTQKLKTNQRKLRLRHLILLALRMLLIALFCLTLYQPTLKSDRLNIRGEQPVATVIVIDTTPSMGYTQNEKTRLDEARRRALELLDELPEKSPVAVITTDDPAPFWAKDVPEARKLIEKLDKPRGGGDSITAAMAQGYGLFAKIDAGEAEDPEHLPKLLAVFTDRTAACWEPARVEDLKKLREKLPDPKPAQVIIDVGIEQPVNVGLLSAELKPQVIPANQPAGIVVTVAASGPADLPPVDTVILAKLDNTGVPLRKQSIIPYGQSRAVTFEFNNLKPGVHQVEFSLEAPDRLMFDNTRFLTFKVGESRRILTIADEPEAAAFWQFAHILKGEFSCGVAKPDDVLVEHGQVVVSSSYPENPAKPDGKWIEARDNLQAFDVVCLFEVQNPNTPAGNTLWDRLRPYVEGGGKLIIIPGVGGPAGLSVEGYAAGGNLMPGTFKRVIETLKLDPPPPKQTAPRWDPPREGKNGVTWFLGDDKALQHPMLRPFQDWQAKGNVDFVNHPRRAWKYWEVEKAPEANVIVSYNDAEKEADRRPAVLERGVAPPNEPTKMKGRVVLLTTRMDFPADPDQKWNDYWESAEGGSWSVVFPNLLARYLAGDTADANFNFVATQTVTVPLPKGGVPRGTKVLMAGPGLAFEDTAIDVGDRQTELRLGPPRTSNAGNFKLMVGSVKWEDGFSLNAPADESTLDKVPVEAIEDLTGKDSVVPLGKDEKIAERVKVIGAPIDLFPWLLIAVLLLLALEGLAANRFYRRVK